MSAGNTLEVSEVPFDGVDKRIAQGRANRAIAGNVECHAAEFRRRLMQQWAKTHALHGNAFERRRNQRYAIPRRDQAQKRLYLPSVLSNPWRDSGRFAEREYLIVKSLA